MTAQRKRPKPIRLTEQRALALIAAAEIGVDVWKFDIAHDIQTTDLDQMRQAQQQDEQRALALDAIELIRTRYLPPPPAPETLF